jgi:hypothetical protein
MTKKSPETLLAILDTLASGNVVYSDAAKANGVGVNTFWHWMRASQLNRDPDLIVPYIGERMPFHVAVEAARQIALHDTRARTEKRSMSYMGEPVFFRDIPAFEPVLAPGEPEEAPRVDAGADIDLDDLLGPEPIAPVREEVATPEPVAEVIPDEVEPVIALAPVRDSRADLFAPPNRAPRSPLEADLMARLAAARLKNAPQTDDGTGQPERPSAGLGMA